MGGAYWTKGSLALDDSKKEVIVSWVLQCQQPDGGFGGNLGHDSHITSTHYALLVLCLYDSIDRVDADRVVRYVQSLTKADGGTKGDEWGKTDFRFLYNAVGVLTLLGRLDAIDRDLAVAYVLSCRNFEGAFGAVSNATQRVPTVQ
jgi:geranylgeranyl transferase type-2 subunit beta